MGTTKNTSRGYLRQGKMRIASVKIVPAAAIAFSAARFTSGLSSRVRDVFATTSTIETPTAKKSKEIQRSRASNSAAPSPDAAIGPNLPNPTATPHRSARTHQREHTTLSVCPRDSFSFTLG